MTTLSDNIHPDDYVYSYRVHWHHSRRTLVVVTLVVVVTIVVVMVSGAQIKARNRLIRVAPDVIVFFGNIVGIIVVNTIQ
jgi:hypothetical protein